MNLSKALRISKESSVAFAGAGGKTTAMFQLARELKPPILITATSHLAASQASLADRHIIAGSSVPFEDLENEIHGVTLITGPIQDDKTLPVDEKYLSWLREYCNTHVLPLLIEADGSRGRPLKASAGHEPPIPEFAELVVISAGLSGVGKRLSDEHVHRPEIFARLADLNIGDQIPAEALARVLLHAEGGLKNIPRGARRVALLNRADTPDLQSMAGKLAKPLLSAFDSVLVASLRQNEVFSVHEEVAGVVLAAGASRRYGRTKQLLDWHGQSFVRAVAKTALSAGLSPVLVITGADAESVEAAVQDLPVQIVRNEAWQEGQASSIRAGVLTLTPGPPLPSPGGSPIGVLREGKGRLPAKYPKGEGRVGMGEVGAAIFLLVDQPQVTSSILSALVEHHSTGLPEILAPLVMDRRANPVLFDRTTFGDLLELQGDVGGRSLFSKYHVEYLPWHDDRLLLDIDTPEQYSRLISDATL